MARVQFDYGQLSDLPMGQICLSICPSVRLIVWAASTFLPVLGTHDGNGRTTKLLRRKKSPIEAPFLPSSSSQSDPLSFFARRDQFFGPRRTMTGPRSIEKRSNSLWLLTELQKGIWTRSNLGKRGLVRALYFHLVSLALFTSLRSEQWSEIADFSFLPPTARQNEPVRFASHEGRFAIDLQFLSPSRSSRRVGVTLKRKSFLSV